MAAMQGYLRGLPSVAASLASFDEDHLRDGAIVAARIAKLLLDSGERQFLNVNAPDRPLDEFTEVRVVPMADLAVSRVVDLVDDQGATRRRLEIRPGVDVDADTDVAVIMHGGVAVTPLHNDLTDRLSMTGVRSMLGDAELL